MLTPEQDTLARAVDAMRRDNDLNTRLALALKEAETHRDAYLKHLEQSQAEVARLDALTDELTRDLEQRVTALESAPAEVVRLNEELENLRDILSQWENGVLALPPDIRADRFAAYCESRGLTVNPDGSASPKPSAQPSPAPTPVAEAENPVDDFSSEDRFSQNRE